MTEMTLLKEGDSHGQVGKIGQTGMPTAGQTVIGNLMHTIARIFRIGSFRSLMADVKATPGTNMM